MISLISVFTEISETTIMNTWRHDNKEREKKEIQLNSEVLRFIENIAGVYDGYGIPRIGGRIFGLCLSVTTPLSAEALKAVKCPMLVLHANWHRYPEFGLVGAMDDNDAKRIMELAPHTQYKKIPANHVIHAFKPKQYIEAVLDFEKNL